MTFDLALVVKNYIHAMKKNAIPSNYGYPVAEKWPCAQAKH